MIDIQNIPESVLTEVQKPNRKKNYCSPNAVSSFRLYRKMSFGNKLAKTIN